ncbi:hypothetical protein GCM10010991_25190 [Gemmobacter aquaticus]|uniref:Uncharacterized protein n=1 Tax=Gemmobacter aquaticus TaxID=490185 RepID=A0A918DD11_9RHOB|nr:GIY-YIG nuclease family protein [Gemmobacter aquaticus]GGO34429.1 hypothetical protein GCM10010991_25190 [Gemmobacter aquaticus]
MLKTQFCLNQSSDVLTGAYALSDRPMNAQIVLAARVKGFRAFSRLRKNGYYALYCLSCGEVLRARHSVILQSQPTCHSCLAEKHKRIALDAGLVLLGRDPKSRHYGIFRALCGHELRREFEFVQRMARGEAAARCETCHAQRQQATALARGWRLIGADPAGRVSYRLYAHLACGAELPIALANMESGRFSCPRCGMAWPAAQSALYVMQFLLNGKEPAIKLGFSKDPASRLSHQLLSGVTTPGQLLRVVPMPTGAAAIQTEKSLHKRILVEMPSARLAPHLFRGQIRVKSEIYAIAALPLINRMLDEVRSAA